MQGKNQILTICQQMPLAMVKLFGLKQSYSHDEVDTVWNKKFVTRHNIKFAYAMFYVNPPGEFTTGYDDDNELRMAIAAHYLPDNTEFSLDAILAFAQVETAKPQPQ